MPAIASQVFIIGHVPPGVFERAPGKKWFYPQFNKKYIDVILKHSDVITGHFLAHQHCDSFKVFYEKGISESSFVRRKYFQRRFWITEVM